MFAHSNSPIAYKAGYDARMKYRLKEYRTARGWTLDQVAGLSGLSKGFLSQIENDRREPGPESLEILAQVFSVPVTDLYTHHVDALSDEEATLLQWFRSVPEQERHLVRRLLQAAAEQPTDAPEATADLPEAKRAPPK